MSGIIAAYAYEPRMRSSSFLTYGPMGNTRAAASPKIHAQKCNRPRLMLEKAYKDKGQLSLVLSHIQVENSVRGLSSNQTLEALERNPEESGSY